MPEVDLQHIRRLRASALNLLCDQSEDLGAFLNTLTKLTFRRLPEQRSRRGDVKVTSSCSCLMSLMFSNCYERVYQGNPKDSAKRAFSRIYNASWRSSGLGLNNAFSTVLVIRTFGLLVEAGVVDPSFATTKKRNFAPLGRVTLWQIARYLGKDLNHFRINKYPSSAALVYWFIDGVDRGKIVLPAQQWRSVCDWARHEFNRQRSLVVAQHEALMDPIAMAMAACLCARLRRVADRAASPAVAACLHLLPSAVELQHGIRVLFDKQGSSGIWPKYFPLFHYPKAGSNFCFTFEMLEAVFAEFGDSTSDLLTSPPILPKIEDALRWCIDNRLKYSVHGRIYYGWNSGGELDSLNDGKPESWATAVVHMFLWELQHVLALKTQFALLQKYNATNASLNQPVVMATKPTSPDDSIWDGMLDMNVRLQGGSKSRIKAILGQHIIKPATKFEPFSDKKIAGRLSVLLFGPPGTSKTRLTSALAAKLGWPVVLIDPSQFLSKGIEQIYSRAEEIFRDLRDLSGVVVLFDEMDALVRARGEKQPLDITSRFLTTSMLPKLASLHDQASLVFFFATNYQKDFDSAIKRPGRFDVLLCVGPPPWSEKLRCIDRFLPKNTPADDVGKVKRTLARLAKGAEDEERELLDLFTFQEAQTFFESITKNNHAGVKHLQKLKLIEFKDSLREFGKYITLRRDGEHYVQFQDDKKESRLQ